MPPHNGAGPADARFARHHRPAVRPTLALRTHALGRRDFLGAVPLLQVRRPALAKRCRARPPTLRAPAHGHAPLHPHPLWDCTQIATNAPLQLPTSAALAADSSKPLQDYEPITATLTYKSDDCAGVISNAAQATRNGGRQGVVADPPAKCSSGVHVSTRLYLPRAGTCRHFIPSDSHAACP